MKDITPDWTYKVKVTKGHPTIFARILVQNWAENFVEYESFDALNWHSDRFKCSPEEFLKNYERL